MKIKYEIKKIIKDKIKKNELYKLIEINKIIKN